MNRILKILVLLLQVTTAFAVGVFIYMLFAILDSDWGLDGVVGLLFQFIWAAIVSLITIMMCLLVGLPIRLNRALREWWGDHSYIPMALFLVGLLMLGLSLLPRFMESMTVDEGSFPRLKQVPNMVLALSGWFSCSFALLHIFPPQRWVESLSTFFQAKIQNFKVS